MVDSEAAREASVTLGTPGWRLLAAHFEEIAASERAEMYALETTPQRRQQIAEVTHGRNKVLRYLSDIIERASRM